MNQNKQCRQCKPRINPNGKVSIQLIPGRDTYMIVYQAPGTTCTLTINNGGYGFELEQAEAELFRQGLRGFDRVTL
jgi:hypothetical protein